mgnify:CR=1 FL=1
MKSIVQSFPLFTQGDASRTSKYRWRLLASTAALTRTGNWPERSQATVGSGAHSPSAPSTVTGLGQRRTRASLGRAASASRRASRRSAAMSCAGVEKAFAVQAGRELRIFVHPNQVDDEQTFALARTVVSRIENDLQYPGQIKVVVIRETRCVELAR